MNIHDRLVTSMPAHAALGAHRSAAAAILPLYMRSDLTDARPGQVTGGPALRRRGRAGGLAPIAR